MPKRLPLIALTQGDPAGIGPEVVIRALSDKRVQGAARYVVVGDLAMLHRVAARLHLRFRAFRPFFVAPPSDRDLGPFYVDSDVCPNRVILCGRPTAAGGRMAASAVRTAVALALNGDVDAIVTAPLSKESLHLAGIRFPGHTEMIAKQCRVRRPVMMMAGGGLRAALVTTHAAIADLPGLITKRAVYETIAITHDDLRIRFGISRPRIVVCGLNPHAGESGLFGNEETQIAAAIKAARAKRVRCEGPVPADVAFTPQRRETCDAIVAMFHDQATIPVKMLAFDSGVNVTLGLPIIRTSPDHGTAYDIAAKGVANPGSMVSAILMAAETAGRS